MRLTTNTQYRFVQPKEGHRYHIKKDRVYRRERYPRGTKDNAKLWMLG